MSPQPHAPRIASVTAWSAASASECPASPVSPGRRTPPARGDARQRTGARRDPARPASAVGKTPATTARSSGCVTFTFRASPWNRDDRAALTLDERRLVGPERVPSRLQGAAEHADAERLRRERAGQLVARHRRLHRAVGAQALDGVDDGRHEEGRAALAPPRPRRAARRPGGRTAARRRGSPRPCRRPRREPRTRSSPSPVGVRRLRPPGCRAPSQRARACSTWSARTTTTSGASGNGWRTAATARSSTDRPPTWAPSLSAPNRVEDPAATTMRATRFGHPRHDPRCARDVRHPLAAIPESIPRAA